jgi:tetratricopeptide (TPR) repeat protein
VALDAGFAEAWRELAAQHFLAGDDVAGDDAYAHYSELTPEPPELSDAIAALAENRLRAARELLLRRLKLAPREVMVLRMLAEVAVRGDDFREAERRLAQCLQLAPGYARARYDLARVLQLLQKDAEALSHIERLLAARPQNAEYLQLKVQSLRFVGRNEEAVALARALADREPQDEGAWLVYGHMLREVGEQAQAIAMYRRAAQVRPASGRAYWSLANLKTFRFDGADLVAMRERLAQPGLAGPERVPLEFALGKALEDGGQFAEAFEHYARGNALQRSMLEYDADSVSADVARSKQIYTRSFFADRAGWGSDQRDPIFIVGLPRSGSTLLEQILGSHSQVETTRELAHIPAIASDVMSAANPGDTSAYPGAVAALGRTRIGELAERYLSQSRVYRALGAARFVDKMLSNFAHIGFIHLMFPRASIIDIRRHPLGSCLACYKQYFARGLYYTYDLVEVGRYYREYVELMEHFDGVLPGRVHRVHYEHLVADPEREVRRLLDYCGLPFEADCLRFYQSRRVVQTISSEQVRRPIYADAVEQWRHYEPWLAPLKAVVADLIERYPPP